MRGRRSHAVPLQLSVTDSPTNENIYSLLRFDDLKTLGEPAALQCESMRISGFSFAPQG
jgi:hypothetical protein